MENEPKKYDWLVVGAGLYGAVFAYEMLKRGQTVLVVDRRPHIGGNCYTENIDGINVHMYGAHIFRTSRRDIWEYMGRFCEFNHFVNSPIANYRGKIYNMPFNMNTFSRIWGVVTPAEAQAKIEEQRREIVGPPTNLEEKAISLVGRDVYEILIREYTEKQWGRPCKELPASIIRRLPVRLTYDNNYFNDPYQGIPKGGYTAIIEKMLSGCDIRLGVDFLENRRELEKLAERILYTGAIDEYYGRDLGALEYRSLRFEHKRMDVPNFQGVAVVNYTSLDEPYTRSIEHKHFEFGDQPSTVVSYEYPFEWTPGVEPYYPINDARNQSLYEKYRKRAALEPKTMFGGRLGTYRYTDMQDTIIAALEQVREVIPPPPQVATKCPVGKVCEDDKTLQPDSPVAEVCQCVSAS